MSKRGRVYLLEVYGVEPPSLRTELEACDGLQVLGLLSVPIDEAILCLVAAATPVGDAVIHAVAERYGPGSRLLPVRWTPLPAVAAADRAG